MDEAEVHGAQGQPPVSQPLQAGWERETPGFRV